MPNPPEQPFPFMLINNVFKGPAHLVYYYITLNLNISAARQNIKKLDDNFWAIHVRTMLANFQASSFTGVEGEWGVRRTHTGCYTIFGPIPIQKLASIALLARDQF